MFHYYCLISEVTPHLKPPLQSRIEEIQRLLTIQQTVQQASKQDNGANSIGAANNREKLLAELDDIVASECVYCGDIMIRSIDQPFILPEESNLVMEGWD